MPIYVNEGYPPAPDGRSRNTRRAAECSQSARRKNSMRRLVNRGGASKLKYADHKRRRCPVCMPDSRFNTEPPDP